MAHSKSNGSHYAITAIGVGMLVLGVVMAVWNLVPGFGSNDNSNQGNSSKPENSGTVNLKSKTFSVAYVLIGSGIALLVVAICLSVRSKRKRRQNLQDSRAGEEESGVTQANGGNREAELPSYSAPSYEEVMRIGLDNTDTTIDRHERLSVNLPSYESLTGLDDDLPTRPNAAKEEQLQRTDSRSGKGKKPLNVRRIKSDKLHLKEFRLNLSGRNKTPQNQSIEPLTPPPQYEDKQLGLNQPM